MKPVWQSSPLLLPSRIERMSRQRHFEVLRLSITSECNLHCAYCRPRQEPAAQAFSAPVDLVLSRVKRLLRVLPIHEIHITGGEPTMHPALPDIVRACRLPGIHSIAVTTNGTFRENLLSGLVPAGLDRLNVSLDAIDVDAFAAIAGLPDSRCAARMMDHIQGNIVKAVSLGLSVKINMTVLRGGNEDQILPVMEWARRNRICVRFLELMRMGPVRNMHDRLFVPAQEILERIGSRYAFTPMERERSATASLFELGDGYRFGVIANHSQPFCEDCNRLRLDSTGRLFGCISSDRGIPLPPGQGNDIEDDQALAIVLSEAMSEKRRQFQGCSTPMRQLGG